MPLKPQTRSEARPSLRRRLATLKAEAARIVLREPAQAEAFPVDACPAGFVPYTRLRPDVKAQERADAIVAAWDQWQATIAAARDAVGLPEAEAAYRESLERYNAILLSVRAVPVASLVGLAAKARIAADLTGYGAGASDPEAVGRLRKAAETFDLNDHEGLLYALLADVLDLTGGPTRG